MIQIVEVLLAAFFDFHINLLLFKFDFYLWDIL